MLIVHDVVVHMQGWNNGIISVRRFVRRLNVRTVHHRRPDDDAFRLMSACRTRLVRVALARGTSDPHLM